MSQLIVSFKIFPPSLLSFLLSFPYFFSSLFSHLINLLSTTVWVSGKSRINKRLEFLPLLSYDRDKQQLDSTAHNTPNLSSFNAGYSKSFSAHFSLSPSLRFSGTIPPNFCDIRAVAQQCTRITLNCHQMVSNAGSHSLYILFILNKFMVKLILLTL